MADSTRPSVLDDARAIAAADPAGQGTAATLLSYPGLHAVAAHRIAHRLWSTRWGRPAAQAIATAAAKATGITIHPGAVLGHRLFIDHGSEVVIGETSVIGDDVTIYQGAASSAMAPWAVATPSSGTGCSSGPGPRSSAPSRSEPGRKSAPALW